MTRELTDGDVLVLRALGLGDLLAGIPALRGVRRRWPGRRLVLAAPRAIGEFLRACGVVDEVLVTSGLDPLPAKGSGHVAVDLHGRGPASQELLLATGPESLLGFRSTATGGPAFPDGPPWFLDEHEVTRWCRLLAAAGGACGSEDLRLRERPAAPPAGPVVVHPGAAFAARRWPVERWAAVVRALTAGGHPVVVTGTADEAGLGAALAEHGARDLTGALDLDGLADAVAASRLVLSGDTGTAHLATAYAVPSVLLFGPTPPHWWGPAIDADLHTVLWHGDPAATDYVGDPHGAALDPTLGRTGVDEVLAAAARHLPR
ncbi:glycosyltransferase family 9 protein [Kineococcus rubinsiae]|uniref:glycosyltransferase family 9 protein n=1 Tax=Kineococcus rubinsiae TaxID=2609562 RepID=UPI0014316B94|nr:glycosyltransferase family 9 protein [Kineococcus rubinsiae]NIZ89513.1 glycosyltransferase family 9 protein [Kineococcus rubinsiae]